MRRPGVNHSRGFKARIGLQTLTDEIAVPEVAKQFHMHPNRVAARKGEPLRRASGMFGGAVSDSAVNG